MQTTIGLDLSLRASGICTIHHSGVDTRRIQPTGTSTPERYADLHRRLTDALTDIQGQYGDIGCIVIEEAIVTRFASTVKKIMMVHGILMAALGEAGIDAPILYVHPTTLKRLVLGVGGKTTSKSDIVNAIANLIGETVTDDEADATALAYIGVGVGVDNLFHAETTYSKIACPVIDAAVWAQFGLTPAQVKDMRRANAQASRRKYKRKSKHKDGDEDV